MTNLPFSTSSPATPSPYSSPTPSPYAPPTAEPAHLTDCKAAPETSADNVETSTDDVESVVAVEQTGPRNPILTIKLPPMKNCGEVRGDASLHHHYFWDSDGDFVFTTTFSSKVYFCVPSTLLLGRLHGFTRQTGDDSPVHFFHDTSIAEWETYLALLSSNSRVRSKAHRQPTLAECIAGLSLSYKLSLPILRLWAEAHLRRDFFSTPEQVREHCDTRQPLAIDGYMGVFAIAERHGLDQYTYTLACYAAALLVDWKDDDFCVDFYNTHPKSYLHVMTGRLNLQSSFSYALQVIAQIPDSILHPTGDPAVCKAALEEWYSHHCPIDVLGTLSALEADVQYIGCCGDCRNSVAAYISDECKQVWANLPRYFGIYVSAQGWPQALVYDGVFSPTFRV